MAQIDEIIGKENIQQFIDLDAKINKVTESYISLLKVVKETKADIGSTDSWTKLKTAQEETTAQTKKLGEAEKDTAKIEKEQAAAVAALEKQRQSAYATMAKQEAKERELTAAINMEVKSIKDAETQNKALMEAKKKLNLTTEEGKKKNEQYNQTLNKNTEFIRKNSDAATQQRMNIGNYKSAMEGLPGPIGQGTAAIGRMGAAMKMLIANPIILFISALVMGLKLLYDSFKSTDEGADKLEQTTGALAAGWKVITDRVGQVISGNMKLGESFSGVRDEITQTAATAANYAAAMDKINERNTLYISDQAKLKKEESELTRVYKDATLTTEDRISAYERVLDIETELMTFKKSQAAEVYRAELVNAAMVQQGSKFTIDQIKEFIEMDAARAEQLKETDPQWKAFWNANQDNIQRLENSYAALTNTETEYYDQTAKKFGAMTKFKQQLIDESIKASLEAQIKTAEATAAQIERDKQIAARAADEKLIITEMSAKGAQQIELDIHAETLELREQMDNDFVEREIENLERAKEEKIAIAQESARALQEIGNMAFDAAAANIQAELDKNAKAKEYELQLAGDNKGAIAVINEKYAEKEKQLKIKAAKQSKAQALFNAIIGTAMATVNGFMSVPFLPVGLAMGILAGVLGTLQIGLIASQPIPQFFKGTDSAPDGLISVGEKGQELIQTRSGKTLLARNRTLLSGMKGATIYSNQETEAILKAGRGGFDTKELRDTLTENNRQLIKTIRDKRELHIQAPKGSRITERKGEYFTHYWNRKLS